MDTKVVDQQGRPLPVFHGTTVSFCDFSTDLVDKNALYGPGLYFTEDPEIASGYATAVDKIKKSFLDEEMLRDFLEDNPNLVLMNQKTEKNPGRPPIIPSYNEIQAEFFDSSKSKPNVHAVYLDIRNPFDMERTKLSPQQLKEVGWERYYGAYRGIKGIIENNPMHAQNLPEILKRLGFDGITHQGGEVTGGKAHRVWIAFAPSQVHPAYTKALINWVNKNCKFASY